MNATTFDRADFQLSNMKGANLENASKARTILHGALLKGTVWIDGPGSIGTCK